jgi:hypothetical protein
VICGQTACNQWIESGKFCSSHVTAHLTDEYQKPPPVKQVDLAIAAMLLKHRAEMANGTWPARDCPICRWVMSKPTIEQRYLSQAVKHSDIGIAA